MVVGAFALIGCVYCNIYSVDDAFIQRYTITVAFAWNVIDVCVYSNVGSGFGEQLKYIEGAIQCVVQTEGDGKWECGEEDIWGRWENEEE